MDLKKIGGFLRELRKENNLTQEQLAEKMNVAGRTVSRWETGHNMPDLSILVELAELYDVSIGEIIDGERKSEKMQEEKELVNKIVEYSELKESYLQRMNGYMFNIYIVISVLIALGAEYIISDPKVALGVAIVVLLPLCYWFMAASWYGLLNSDTLKVFMKKICIAFITFIVLDSINDVKALSIEQGYMTASIVMTAVITNLIKKGIFFGIVVSIFYFGSKRRDVIVKKYNISDISK